MNKILVLVLVGMLFGCASDPDPRQRAAALNLEYQVMSGPIVAFIQSPLSDDTMDARIKAIDSIVFSWIQSATEAAKKWQEGDPEVDNEGLLTIFNKMHDKASKALDTLAEAIGQE